MKKFFTLIAMAAVAMGVNAQKITWGEGDIATAGSLDGKEFVSGDFKLAVTDTDGKVAIDANNAYFGTAEESEKLTHRLKSGGKSSSKNQLTLTIPSAGTLKVFVRTGSNSATDRNIVLTQNEAELYNQLVLESNAAKVAGFDESDPSKETNVYPVISVPVEAGTVIVTYPTGSLNFYGFELVGGGATPVDAEVWTVAGGSKLMGSDWSVTDEANLMTTIDGANYTLVKTDVVLEKGVTYQFKVAKDNAWTTSYPSSNYELTVEETATYTVTFSFNNQTNEVSATAVKTGEAQVAEKVYSVIGNFKGDTNWTIDYDMTKGADGIFTAVIDGVAAGAYEFKVRADHDWSEAYPVSNYSITVDADNAAVTVTFNPDTKEVTAVAGTAGINAVKAEKNGVKYNLAGQKVNGQYKGVVIVNGRKVVK